MNEMRKLMEAVQINEEYVEYRDPDGEFLVYYSFPRGYWAVGKNDAAQDISGESFDDLDDAIEHAEICLSMSDDNYDETNLQAFDRDMSDSEPYVEEDAEQIEEAEGDVDQVFSNLQRELTSVAMKAQQAASFIKRLHPEETDKYNLAVDIEMELDQLRKRVFAAR